MSWWAVFHMVEWAVCIAMLPVILKRRFAPVTALAWLSVIFLEPLLGAIVYGLVGNRRLGAHRFRRRRHLIRALRSSASTVSEFEHVTRPQVDPASMPLILQAERYGGMPIVGRNGVELLPDAGTTIDRLIEDIDHSEHHVHLLFYIFAPDETGRRVADALVRATCFAATA